MRRIGTKLALGFALLVAMAVGVGSYALVSLAGVRDVTTTISDHDLRFLDLVRRLTAVESSMRILRERQLVLYLLARQGGAAGEDPRQLQRRWEEAQADAAALLGELEETASEYEGILISPQRKVRWAAIREAAGRARRVLDELGSEARRSFELQNRAALEDVVEQRRVLQELRGGFEAELESIAQQTVEIGGLGRRAAVDAYHRARLSIVLALVLAVVVAGLLGVSVQRSISRPLAAVVGVIERVGEGDLTQRAEESGDEEIARLGVALNRMAAGLRRVATQIHGATETLSAATSEILASAQQQVSSSTEQAAAVQQTNTTVTEINESGSQVAERAQQVATSAEAAASASQEGVRAVRDVTVTMEGIREQAEAVAENVLGLSAKTQEIGEIIATVNDIAERSHLLSLNAAIEAAAAGEQGRSFGVVAAEIKNLADQAKEATVQVRTLLGDIQKGINTSVMLTEEAVKRIAGGKERADTADATIQALAANVEESVRTFQQIIAATNQQRIGFEQVGDALGDIRLATEQTAASTRQMEKAAGNLSQLAGELKEAVAVYRL